MMHRAPRPCVASLTKPISPAMVLMRENIEPVPPAPGLFINEKSVSAGERDKMIGCELELAEILLARRLAPIAIAGAK